MSNAGFSVRGFVGFVQRPNSARLRPDTKSKFQRSESRNGKIREKNMWKRYWITASPQLMTGTVCIRNLDRCVTQSHPFKNELFRAYALCMWAAATTASAAAAKKLVEYLLTRNALEGTRTKRDESGGLQAHSTPSSISVKAHIIRSLSVAVNKAIKKIDNNFRCTVVYLYQ